MEIIVKYIVGITAIVLPIIIKVFASEYANKLAQQLFKTKSKKKADSYTNWIVVVFVLVGLLIIAFTYRSQTIIQLPQKTDAEVIGDGITKISEKIIEDAPEWDRQRRENKREKERIFQESREQMWVYKIGTRNANERSLLELRERIQKIYPNSIHVFKEGRKFFLFKREGNSTEQSLKASLDSFKSTIDTIEPEVDVINLMEKCGKKETVVQDVDFVKDKKHKREAGCWACSKR